MKEVKKKIGPPETDEPSHYIPGHTKRKGFFMVLGVLFVLYGLSEIRGSLLLLFTGTPAEAVATRVVETAPARPDHSFNSDFDLTAAERVVPPGALFWNEFEYTGVDGKAHAVRCPIGSRMKPLFPLLDDDGLPTTVLVRYDARVPGRICFPLVVSTWFSPLMVVFTGVVCIVCGSFLFFSSRKPIEISPPPNG